MKMLYPYNKFISESIKDLMTPKSEEDIRNIIEKEYVSFPDDQLKYAAEAGYVDLVQKAIDNGANVNDPERKALKNAILGRHYDVIDLLIKNGLKLKKDRYLDEFIINDIIKSDDVKLVKSVITKRKLIGLHQIYFAMEQNNKEILDYFLDKVELNEEDQRTLLEGAVIRHNIDMLKYLFERGLKTTGHWIVQKAVETCKMDILEMVLQYGKFTKYSIDEAVIFARQIHRDDMVEVLRKYKYTD